MNSNCLFVFVVIASCTVVYSLAAGCSPGDCISVRSCAEATPLVRKNDKPSQTLLRKAFCGFDGNQTPMICCSSLANLENHPNRRLLPQQCGFINKNRIIGGNEAGIYEFPWMALISHETRDHVLSFQCGGTLINNRYVLTAAHCIKNQNIAGVRIGEHDTRTNTDCQGKPPEIICETHIQDMAVEESIIHPDYKGKPGVVTNDIGLIRLSSPVDFTHKNADAVCLPISSSLRDRDIGGMNGTIAGWGVTENHESSPILLAADVPIYTVAGCRALYNRGLNAAPVDNTLNKFCAGQVGRDSCHGDSGGPLMVPGFYNTVSRYIQYGIVSYGPRKCGSDFPGVYTDVTKFMKWILDTIRD